MLDASVLTWRETRDIFLKRVQNPNTQKAYKTALTLYKKHARLYDVNLHPVTGEYREIRSAIEDWVFSSTAQVKAATAQVRLSAVKTFYQFLINEEFIELVKNPATGIPVYNDDPPRRPTFPDKKLAKRVEECFRKETEVCSNCSGTGKSTKQGVIVNCRSCSGEGTGQIKDIRNWLMFRFLIEGGFRVGELCSIKLQDIDFQSGKVSIAVAKGNKTRITAVLKETVLIAADFASLHHLEPHDYLFMPDYQYLWKTQKRHKWSKGSHPIATNYVNINLRRIADKYDFTEVEINLIKSPHRFRHLWAVNHVAAGTDYIYIMMMGGWENVNMLKHYINHASFEVKAVGEE